ncbi:MAG: thiamine phosphate synthase, partial [Rhodobacteraceae bacterium]|nr:thiamine phosphate synthase [Paracoccaceae bacterium]
MPGPERARLYLVTPPILSLDVFGEVLAGLLDVVEIACVRLALATTSEDELTRAADGLRAV